MAVHPASDAFNQRVGANLQRFRRLAGLSQAELARRLTDRGLPFQQQTILKVEKGSRPLRFEEAHVIASELGMINPSLLVDYTDDQEREAALSQLRAAEVGIASAQREIEVLRQQISDLEDDMRHRQVLRNEARNRLATLFNERGRPDLAILYVDDEGSLAP